MEWLSGFGDVKAAGKSSGESRCWRSSAALPGPLPAPQRRQPADGAGGEALRCFVREEMRRGDFSLRLRLFFFVVRLLSLLLCCSASASLRSLRGLRALLLAQAGAGLPRGRAPGRGGARRGAVGRGGARRHDLRRLRNRGQLDAGGRRRGGRHRLLAPQLRIRRGIRKQGGGGEHERDAKVPEREASGAWRRRGPRTGFRHFPFCDLPSKRLCARHGRAGQHRPELLAVHRQISQGADFRDVESFLQAGVAVRGSQVKSLWLLGEGRAPVGVGPKAPKPQASQTSP